MFKSWPVITTLAVLGLTNFASVALSASAENDGIVRVASAVPIEEAAKRIKQAVAEKGIHFSAKSIKRTWPRRQASSSGRGCCSSW